jgi:hypothetical protein
VVVGSEPGTVEIIDLGALKTVASVDAGEEAAGVDFFKTEPAKSPLSSGPLLNYVALLYDLAPLSKTVFLPKA